MGRARVGVCHATAKEVPFATHQAMVLRCLFAASLTRIVRFRTPTRICTTGNCSKASPAASDQWHCPGSSSARQAMTVDGVAELVKS